MSKYLSYLFPARPAYYLGLKFPGLQFQNLSVSSGTGVQLTNYGLHDNGQDLLHVETRNLCRCETCFGKHSHQKTGVPSEGNLYPGVKITEIGKISPNYLSLKWSDGHQGLIARSMRGEYGPEPVTTILDKYLAITLRQNHSQQFWTSETSQNSKKFDYNTVASSLENIREFFAHYMIHGIAFLTGVPKGQGLSDIATNLKFGPLRDTVFGSFDVVRFKPNPKNIGYASGRLAGHLDLTYYYETPQVQCFHCIENTVEGGDSFWVDTYSAVQEIQTEHPEYFEVLCTVPMFNRHTPPGTDRYLRSHHHLVSMVGDNINQVNCNTSVIDIFLATRWLDLETRRRWWDAYLYFRSKVEDQSRWIVRKLEGGEVVITDNWRVYHGRKEFHKTSLTQERIVETAYANWNHMQRVMLSPLEADQPCFLETHQHTNSNDQS